MPRAPCGLAARLERRCSGPLWPLRLPLSLLCAPYAALVTAPCSAKVVEDSEAAYRAGCPRCASTGHLLNENVICKLNGNPAGHRRGTRRRKAQALTGGAEVTEAPRPGLPGPPRRLRRTPAPPAGTRTWDEAAGPPRPHSTLTQRSTGSLQSAPQARERSGPRLPAAGHTGRGPQHPECSRHPLPTRTNGHAN